MYQNSNLTTPTRSLANELTPEIPSVIHETRGVPFLESMWNHSRMTVDNVKSLSDTWLQIENDAFQLFLQGVATILDPAERGFLLHHYFTVVVEAHPLIKSVFDHNLEKHLTSIKVGIPNQTDHWARDFAVMESKKPQPPDKAMFATIQQEDTYNAQDEVLTQIKQNPVYIAAISGTNARSRDAADAYESLTVTQLLATGKYPAQEVVYAGLLERIARKAHKSFMAALSKYAEESATYHELIEASKQQAIKHDTAAVAHLLMQALIQYFLKVHSHFVILFPPSHEVTIHCNQTITVQCSADSSSVIVSPVTNQHVRGVYDHLTAQYAKPNWAAFCKQLMVMLSLAYLPTNVSATPAVGFKNMQHFIARMCEYGYHAFITPDFLFTMLTVIKYPIGTSIRTKLVTQMTKLLTDPTRIQRDGSAFPIFNNMFSYVNDMQSALTTSTTLGSSDTGRSGNPAAVATAHRGPYRPPAYARNLDNTIFYGPGSTTIQQADQVEYQFTSEHEAFHAQQLHPQWRQPVPPGSPGANTTAVPPSPAMFRMEWTTEVPADTTQQYTADMWVFVIDPTTGRRRRYVATAAPCSKCPCLPMHSVHKCRTCNFYGHHENLCRQRIN